MIRIVLIAIAAMQMIAQTSQSAMAASGADFVKCVQAQLTDLPGYDPRGVDGAIGPGTRAAAAEYAADHPALALPELGEDSAEAWCRQMAEVDPQVLMQRVVIDTDLPGDYQMGLRIFGGADTQYRIGAIDIATSVWTMADVSGTIRRTAAFPKALLARATYFCLDSQGEPAFKLAEKLENPTKRNALTGTHPNYMGICRWRADGRVLTKRTDVVAIQGNGDLTIRYRVKPY